MTPNTPAGGAVAWRVDWDYDDWHQYHDANDPLPPPDGWMDPPSRVVALYEAPPATVPADAVLALVGKWRKDAERLDKSFGPGDMILACGKRADADELEALTRGEK